MRKQVGVMALAAAGALAFGGTYAKAANIGVLPTKLIVVDKIAASGTAKAVFVAKDALIDKGAGTDPADIEASLDMKYDNGTDPAISGQFLAPQGALWLVNKTTVAKYVNKLAPAGGDTKVSVIKPGNLVKLVGKDLGDTPLNVLAAGSVATGTANTAYCLDNGGTQNCFCSTLSGCAWKSIAGGTGAKLVCKGGVADGACSALVTPVPLRFTTGAAGGVCGEGRDGGSGGVITKSLTCGGLNIGGAGSTVPEGPTPAGADTFFNAACAAGTCAVSARTAAQTGSPNNCSDTGCAFGPFLSIANGGLSTCVRNTFASPGSGTLTTPGGDFAGSVPLTSAVNVTGNAANPCPSCSGAPGPGVCDGTATIPASPCTGVNAAGDTHDCLPGGVALAPFPVNLTPISTNTETKSDPAGSFCPGQDATAPGLNGCFASATCDYIEERGADAAGITDGGAAVAGRLASVFCIPATGNGLIDGAADLPGPGATTLPGTFELN